MASSVGIFIYSLIKRDVKLVTLNGKDEVIVNAVAEEFADIYETVIVTFKDKDEELSYTYKDLGIQIQWTDKQRT